MASALLDTIAAGVTAAREIERSRFLATLHPVADEDAAGEVLSDVRRRHADAGHHATALVLGPDGGLHRASDDGEPAGTAGAPMLAVLTGAGISDVVAVVSRWFGGTLLGAGGLVRAYGGTLSDAVARAQRLRREVAVDLEVVAPLGSAGRVEHELHHLAGGLRLDLAPGRYTPESATIALTAPADGTVATLEERLARLDAEVVVVERGTCIRAVAASR